MPETHVNMYGGSPLNRLSWLRTSHSFLNAVITVPSTKWLLFKAGEPLVASSGSSKPYPIYLSTADVKSFLGPEPYFGQAEKPGELVIEKDGDEHSRHSPTEAARHLGPPVVFLGVHEPQTEDSTSALPSSEFKDPQEAIKRLEGTPYFAFDIADLEYPPENLQEILDATSIAAEGKSLSWSEPRALMSVMDPITAAIFASARSLVDWNQRNKFCAGCGSPTYSMWGGWKISCTSLLPWTDNGNKKPCPTTKGLHNFTHPRTDAVVIMIAIDETGEKVLLGRGRRFPGKFYSALAGFIEPGESFEDAVAREMWEEAGVRVWNVKYHSGQPWPYPANLMVGFYARADSTKPIRTDLDNELVDARWFSREEVRAVLNHNTGTTFRKADYKKMAEIVDGRPNTEQKLAAEPAAVALTPSEVSTPAVEQTQEAIVTEEPPFRLPPLTAIAGVLIRDWVDGKIGFPPEAPIQRGNL
ncbi:NAD-capped RNA hydrolase [Psilocybe cubensis]|uniref:NAD-capped RNA hydrolase n=2 Tax=Psilocybe cubensis TaxID=181762 RepID=A0ACB8H9Q3_PSICU|nr:NAD-capped RNA hydrolase [Psilocybe cubensis]KAH9484377.1 NAD-capped RNA hydrolase [Psilocybe cubensis]